MPSKAPFQILAILNATPDSFYSGSRYFEEAAIERGFSMLDEGADALDIGGQSTRPGADLVSAQEEVDRVIPIIEGILKERPSVAISIDTFRSSVAKHALLAGATWVNDISFGEDDPGMWPMLLEHPGTGYIGMHKQGSIANMQDSPHYQDVGLEVSQYLSNKAQALRLTGFEGPLVLDPGFGFGKTLNHNYQLFSQLPALVKLPYPILVGVSRKSMIYKLLGTNPEHALNGSTALHALALQMGAGILRVHDPKEAKETWRLVQAVVHAQGL
ncbi:MAG: dihydropteroate synthase [Bacteroidia bacterium]